MKTKLIYIDGFKIHTRYDRSQGDYNVIKEVIDGDCYRLSDLSKHISPDLILDIGGHIGTFGLLVKKYWPNAFLIAIEPNKISFELYSKNMRENGYSDFIIMNKAISYNPDSTYLLDGPTATGGGFIRTKEQAETAEKGGIYKIFHTDVLTITIEELIKQFHIKKIDLSKWDCEGGERDAFKNMTEDSAKKFLYMLGEYHITGGAPEFIKLVNNKFPHLKTMTKKKRTDTCHIGGFWIKPKRHCQDCKGDCYENRKTDK